MAIQITRWSPDTCGCTLDLAWDDAVDASARTHTLSAYVVKDAAHAALTDDDAHTQVRSENMKKNQAVDIAVTNFGVKSQDVQWSFDGSRNLVVSVPSLTALQNTTLQTLIGAAPVPVLK